MTIDRTAATQCGVLAMQAMQAGSGQVLAVFESTAYLVNDYGKLFCIGPSSMPAGPINLAIHCACPTLPGVGQRWQFDNHCLTTTTVHIAGTERAPIWRPPSPLKATPKRLQSGLKMVQPLVTKLTRPAAIDGVSTILNAGCVSLQQWLAASRPNCPLPDDVVAMMGCGEGLTPAGDDVLCGFLIALHSLSHPAASHLSKAVQPLLATRTSQISAAHLQAACRGMGIELLHDLIAAIASDNSTRAAASIDALNHYGHSSGFYAAMGMTQAICMANIESQTRCRSHFG